jgi:hypothetical protein
MEMTKNNTKGIRTIESRKGRVIIFVLYPLTTHVWVLQTGNTATAKLVTIGLQKILKQLTLKDLKEMGFIRTVCENPLTGYEVLAKMDLKTITDEMNIPNKPIINKTKER